MIAEHFDASFEIKLLGETGIFEGYASVFHVTDSVNDVIAPGAFAKTLAAWKQDGRMPPLLWQHDMKEPIGAWREIFEDSHGLFVRGELFVNDILRAREAYKLLRENVVTGLSIGYRVLESHRDQKSGSRVLTDVELMEVSMVTMPANDHARVARVKSFFSAGEAPSEREFEAFLREAGLSRKQAKGVVAQGYKALKTYDPRDAEDEIESTIVALSEKIKQLT